MTDIPNPAPSLFRLFNRMGGWMVIVVGVFLLLFTLISSLAFETAKRFDREGQPATATVHERYTTTSTDADGDTTTTYWLSFDFVTARKEEITLTESVGTSLYRRVRLGGTFELLYLTTEPDRVETNPGSNLTLSRITQGVALVWGLLWLGGLWLVGGWAVAAMRARKYGRRQTVKLTEVFRTGVRINDRPRYRLKWVDGDGRPGKSLMQKPARVKGYRSGDEIDIYKGVKTGWWVGDVGERPE